MNINEVKSYEMKEIIDFYYFIEDYGHIYYPEVGELNAPFKKILDGINEVRELIEQSYDR